VAFVQIYMLTSQLLIPTAEKCVRLNSDGFKLFLVNVHIPYEGNDIMTDEFADHLNLIENIVSDNIDCHVKVGSDFNNNLSRAWVHTAMLNSFCSNNGLCFAQCHEKSQVDYS
jgi:hypothetical protein